MAAGIATLTELTREGVWRGIADRAAELAGRLEAHANAAHQSVQINRVGTMMTLFFSGHPVTNWTTAKACDTARFAAFFRVLLERGVYWVPSQFEAAFLSAAHGPAELDLTDAAAGHAFAALEEL